MRQIIRNDPLNDLPRLIYADWLEENDNPERAEFIRLQLARKRGSQLGSREEWLLERNYEKWVSDDVGFVPMNLINHRQIGFFRGFAWHITATQTEIEQYGNYWADHISLESIRIHGFCDLERLGNCCLINQLQHLKLDGCGILDVGARLLALLPALGRLKSLDLVRNDITTQGIFEFLTKPGGWPNLEHLNLSSNPLRDDGVQCLAGSVAIPELRVLRLDDCCIGAPGIEQLSTAVGLANLIHIAVSSNRLTYLSVLRLLHSPHLPRLERVECALPNRSLISERTGIGPGNRPPA